DHLLCILYVFFYYFIFFFFFQAEDGIRDGHVTGVQTCALPICQQKPLAVQHPPKAFADPGLKVVTLELDRFGMPKPATGGNAVVYKAKEPGGFLAFKKTWAIRCFLRPISDHAERYEAISKHLRKVRLPYDVNFQFL